MKMKTEASRRSAKVIVVASVGLELVTASSCSHDANDVDRTTWERNINRSVEFLSPEIYSIHLHSAIVIGTT